MAGDWIKMRSDLFTHPKVVRISSALKADTLRTVGGLMSVWCLFDAHSADGILEGYRLETLDDHLRWPGFAAAMMAVRWLSDDGESLVLPEFDTHNGQSAKRRAQDADRKQAVRKASASEADKTRTREEKRREELSTESQKQEQRGVTAAGLACRAMKAVGCLGVNPAHPDLLAALEEGVTAESLAATVREGLEAGKPRPFAWAIATARGRHREGAKPTNARAGPMPNGSPSKTMQGLQLLEDMKRGLAGARTDDGIPEATLLGHGEAAGC